MDDLRVRLAARLGTAERAELLTLLAAAISGLTVVGRTCYTIGADGYAEVQRGSLTEMNEAIHRLAGQLQALCDASEPFADHRPQIVGVQLDLLPDALIEQLLRIGEGA